MAQRDRVQQDLGDAAGCSIPFLLRYPVRVKDNMNLEKTWPVIFSCIDQLAYRQRQIPSFQIQLCQELMTSRAEELL
ncbi:hypothetical protein llap_19758 [Limosa lapponica baueri]|uniref:Uncharacterized protein n=1 Tax=Limosa lapponica baueri TaxID=1758121 RepID=A0A2I0T835_LIMLA|nr:hypothetical protein llap_19758 [Limosa lapponica baueri]